MSVRVLVCNVGADPSPLVIGERIDELAVLQAACGGDVQVIRLPDGVDLYCNENGIYEQLPFNRVVAGGHRIVGDFVLARVDAAGELASLTDTDVAKYSREYKAAA